MADRHDHFIASLVSIAIIDLLEMVDVRNDQRELMAKAQRARGFLAEPIGEQASIGQAGQLIVQRVLFGLIFEQNQFVFCALPVGDVVTVKISHAVRRD